MWGNPQTSCKWTDTHISCLCRETRSPLAASDAKGRKPFSFSGGANVSSGRAARWEHHFTAHPVGSWVLCQRLPLSRQFIWVNFSEMAKNGHCSDCPYFSVPKGQEKNLLLFDFFPLLKKVVSANRFRR